MRLNDEIREYIKSRLNNIDPESKVYLFGSRTDDQTKGGDIDILWLTREKIPQHKIRRFKGNFYKKFGWQKIDVVNFTFQQEDTFKQIALDSAVEL
jgi:predicted nucleotidyltransferase